MEDIAVSPYNLSDEVLKEFHLPDEIIIYDSTLRDGEQMPGLSFTAEQKLAIARKLDEIGIPEIEAGFPAISHTECHTIKRIAHEGLSAKILVLSRLKTEDIDAAITSDADLILLFIASSPLHLKHKLHCTEEQIKEKVIDSIQYAKDHGITPSFSTEDSTRTPLPFLKELVTIAYKAGAKRIGFTDTLGCATPQTIHYLYSQMKNLVSLPLSCHLHNDFGLGLINAIAALGAGATHVCATINGIGERAGNVPLEQLIMALQILYQKDLGIDTTQLKDISELVATYAHHPLPKTQPLVGDHAFTHESGIHVAAMLEHPRTYESITPEIVGNTRDLVIGKHSGRTLIRQILREQQIHANEQIVSEIIEHVKQLAETNGALSKEDLHRIIQDRTEVLKT